MKASDRPAPGTRGRRRLAALTMAFIAAAAAVISYLDGLYLVHVAGATGQAAFLYPLLPDGLIVISFESLHDAAQCGHPRPRWATAGIAFGAALTVAMNVAAGAGVKVPLALVDGVVPLVFFVALEILIGLIRRGRGGGFPDRMAAALATSGHPGAPDPPDTLTALRWLLGSDSQRSLAAALGVPKSRPQAWAAMVKQAAGDTPTGTAPMVPGGASAPLAGAAPAAAPASPARGALNGDGRG